MRHHDLVELRPAARLGDALIALFAAARARFRAPAGECRNPRTRAAVDDLRA